MSFRIALLFSVALAMFVQGAITDHRTEVRWFWVCRLIAGRAACG